MSRIVPQYCQNCFILYEWAGACPNPLTSIFYTWVSLVPYVIMMTALVAPIYTRRLNHCLLGVMLLSAYVVSDRIIKDILQGQRPSMACKKTYGMPSSHMVVMVGYAFYILRTNSNVLVHGAIISFCVLLAVSRVFLHYHTIAQVVAGAFFSLIYCFCFQTLTNFILSSPRAQGFVKKYLVVD